MAVGIGKVRLDIVKRRAVHQVCACHRERGCIRAVIVNAAEPHGGQTDRVGTEGRTRGEHTHRGIPAEARRTHHGLPLPVAAQCRGKLPQQPEVREALQPPQCIRVTVGRFKDNPRLQIGDAPALARNAELFREVRPDVRNGTHGHDALLRPADIRAAHGAVSVPMPSGSRSPYISRKPNDCASAYATLPGSARYTSAPSLVNQHACPSGAM